MAIVRAASRFATNAPWFNISVIRADRAPSADLHAAHNWVAFDSLVRKFIPWFSAVIRTLLSGKQVPGQMPS